MTDTPRLGEGSPAPTVPVPADARPADPATQSRVGPGGHLYTPAAETSSSAAGARVRTAKAAPRGRSVDCCTYCRGAGVVVAVPVHDDGSLNEPGAEPVWCVCEWGRRAELVHGAASAYVDEHGFAPTVRDLMRSTHLALHAIRPTVDRLERAGLAEQRNRTPRSLRVIQGGQS